MQGSSQDGTMSPCSEAKIGAQTHLQERLEAQKPSAGHEFTWGRKLPLAQLMCQVISTALRLPTVGVVPKQIALLFPSSSEGGGLAAGDACTRRTDAFSYSGGAASARRARASPSPRCRAELSHWRAERMEPICDTARSRASASRGPTEVGSKAGVTWILMLVCGGMMPWATRRQGSCHGGNAIASAPKVLYNPYMKSGQIGNLLGRFFGEKLGNGFGFQILGDSPLANHNG